jgi:hypothetical protein
MSTDVAREAGSVTMQQEQDATILELTYHADARVRRTAVQQLCPCHLKANYAPVWTRILEMVSDADAKVRGTVLHVLCDGSPRAREAQVVAALTTLEQDPDAGVRRRARQVMAAYRRVGRVNLL